MDETVEKSWVPLTSNERRVIGVMVEKAKTTPEYYPLTIAAIVTGCNQKSNRDPVTTYDADDVEDYLTALRKKGAVIMVEGSGRVVRYKHTLYDWLKVTKVELAVVAELLLRGSQTEGDLRARANRMEPLADLGSLQTVLASLIQKGLVVRLSPAGVQRGVVVTHALYSPNEMERERAKHANSGLADEPDEPARPEPVPSSELATIRVELDTLRESVRLLTEEVQALKTSLGV